MRGLPVTPKTFHSPFVLASDDPHTTPPTFTMDGGFRRGGGRAVGAVDADGGPRPGRRRVDRAGVRRTRPALQEEPDARPLADAGGSGAATSDVEAHSGLELPDAGAGSAGEPGVPELYAHRRREGARR